MNSNPNESIAGMIIALAEVGLQIYIFATRNKRSGVKMSEEAAKGVLSEETLAKGQKDGENIYFEGKAADEANRELIDKDLITDERYVNVCNENPHMFEDNALEEVEEFLPWSDFELDGEDFEIGG